jgi:NAD(P)-dependent dehydrogenase (short-subunit alcohol dehydrogenase family)
LSTDSYGLDLPTPRVLIFGSTGFLAGAIKTQLEAHGTEVIGVTRGESEGNAVSLRDANWLSHLSKGGTFSGVVWAQGENSSGGVMEEDSESIHRVFDANVVFITENMRSLVEHGLIQSPGRVVILSSVWQMAARSKKLGYLLAKSAISGLVPSLAIDLADRNIAVNAVLPGVIESPMARVNLSDQQISEIEGSSIGGALATAEDVAKVTAWLLSPDSSGLNAQSLVVDKGWSKIRHV